jgi:hypothetical protein
MRRAQGISGATFPKDLPPKSTLHDYLVRWKDGNALTAIHYVLPAVPRDDAAQGHPTAYIIDSTTVRLKAK